MGMARQIYLIYYYRIFWKLGFLKWGFEELVRI
jgi:hypothetical protein